MTEQEYDALISILNRVPVTPAESLWLIALLERLRPQTEQPSSVPVKE